MAEDVKIFQIYLYKPPVSEDVTSSWVYYRVESIDSPDAPRGKPGATVEVCRVRWPDFADIPPATWTTGVTGLPSAANHVKQVVEGQYKVENAEVILIGQITKDVVPPEPSQPQK